MDDLTREIEDIRVDIETLQALIDSTLDKGASGEDINLRALADVLHDRRRRLEHLECAAGNAPSAEDDLHDAGQRAE